MATTQVTRLKKISNIIHSLRELRHHIIKQIRFCSDHNPFIHVAFGQWPFAVNPDFLLKLPECLFFGVPYRLFC
jgi:hypothetical protein